ncbi:MAG: peptidase M14 [Planctomycetota bacterium]|nr:MAG: peptidase M14 [Planctomycetota bacterium]
MRLFPVLCGLALLAPAAAAQGGRMQPKVEIAWNRYYDHAELLAIMDRLQAAWPEFVRFVDIGESYEGRRMRVLVLANQRTGEDTGKPAMWVDGNVHGNEVQGAEAALYLAWWLLEHYADNERARKLLDTRAFYILPSQNPDGRDSWFHDPHDAHSSRTGRKPYDNDRDGLLDEDGPDDLDGDGEILSMRKKVAPGTGDYRLHPDDARILIRADREHPGDYELLGDEGLDNDGDGRVNEDGVGGYDMNRNWPSDWQPGHIQFGAGDYPLSFPETRAIAAFLLAHPNVAAVQSFHNSGGMILRGPGDQAFAYPGEDAAVYDAIGQEGELILPFYRYMIIWRDLYTVHGGFVNWTYEGLGIFSFTNELWASPQYYGGGRERPGPSDYSDGQQNEFDFNDSVLLGQAFVDWHPARHPLYGEVEIGGFKREHGRVAPSFMIEEMLHRNAMFCVRHAEEIAELEALAPKVEPLEGGLHRVTVTLVNDKTMPTRSAMAGREHIGTPDSVSLEGPDLTVLAGGVQTDRWRPERLDWQERDPARLRLERGVPGHGSATVAWIVRGRGDFTVQYVADKADDVRVTGTLPR